MRIQIRANASCTRWLSTFSALDVPRARMPGAPYCGCATRASAHQTRRPELPCARSASASRRSRRRAQLARLTLGFLSEVQIATKRRFSRIRMSAGTLRPASARCARSNLAASASPVPSGPASVSSACEPLTQPTLPTRHPGPSRRVPRRHARPASPNPPIRATMSWIARPDPPNRAATPGPPAPTRQSAPLCPGSPSPTRRTARPRPARQPPAAQFRTAGATPPGRGPASRAVVLRRYGPYLGNCSWPGLDFRPWPDCRIA
jgi:hypothetical protein